MLRKLLLSLLSSVLLCSVLPAQTTQRPRVDSQYQSQFGTYDIAGVIAKDDVTLILIEANTNSNANGLVISFIDDTILTFGGRRLRIRSWGYWDGEEIHEKEFNTQYSLKNGTQYYFVLVFPEIPESVKVISVKENTSGGFYWNGIHLNRDGDRFSGGSYSGRDRGSSGSGSAWGSGSDRGERKEDRPGGSGYERGGKEERGGREGRGGKDGYNPPRSDGYYPPQDDHFDPNGSGTCFALNSDGYIATCYHVIENARKIRIRGIDGDFNKLYKARVVLSDRTNDLAILKIDDPSFRSLGHVPYGVAERPSDVGESIFVLGYPLRAVMGDEIKLTNGIISSGTGYQGDETSYQISAAVQSGNSGGPLFNESGFVVGVVNARLAAVESAAYAVKSSYLTALARSSRPSVSVPRSGSLSGKSLAEKVRLINRFVYIIEVE